MQLILSEFTPLALSLCSCTLGGTRAREAGAAPALPWAAAREHRVLCQRFTEALHVLKVGVMCERELKLAWLGEGKVDRNVATYYRQDQEGIEFIKMGSLKASHIKSKDLHIHNTHANTSAVIKCEGQYLMCKSRTLYQLSMVGLAFYNHLFLIPGNPKIHLLNIKKEKW